MCFATSGKCHVGYQRHLNVSGVDVSLAETLPSLGWHYLSNATCLLCPHLLSTALLV